MCRPSRWRLGLLPLAVLLLAALWWKTPQVEADVSAAAASALAGQGVIDPVVSAAGRDVRLLGVTPGAPAAAVAAAEAAPGVRLVADELKPLPSVSPYDFAARREGGVIALTGHAPDPATKARLVAAARAIAPQVEDKLTLAAGAPQGFEAMAGAALGLAGKLPQVEASLSGSALSVRGAAADQAGYDAALAALKTPPAGMSVAKAEILPPPLPAADWRFSAARTGAGVTLTGVVPDMATREALVQGAKAMAGTVEDHLTIARGAPEGFSALARAALGALAPTSAGEAKVEGGKLAVSGLLAPGGTASAATQAAQALLPKGVAGGFDWRYGAASPFVFEARKVGSGALTLSGSAPSEAALAALETAARGLGGPVSGAPALASGLSPKVDFSRAADLGFSILKRLTSGWMKIANDGLSFGGIAPEGEIAALRQLASASGLPIGAVDLSAPPKPAPAPVKPAPAEAKIVILPPEPPPIYMPPAPAAGAAAQTPPAKTFDAEALACRDRLLADLAQEKIEFATGSAHIAPRSMGLIGRLAGVIKGCPTASLEVDGHTDNVGKPEANLTLSQERAAAVAKALVAAGAPAARLSSAGFGQDRPVASNDTPEGRARNRRIDFVLK